MKPTSGWKITTTIILTIAWETKHLSNFYIAESNEKNLLLLCRKKGGLTDSAALKIAKDYNVLSFMIKTHALQALPQLILSRSPKDGVLADMRNIPGSHAYVVDFKKLNWGRIWYQDTSGKQKVVVRPAGGWVI